MRFLFDNEIREILNEVRTRASSELESEVLEFKGHRDEHAFHNAKDIADELSARPFRTGCDSLRPITSNTNATGRVAFV